MFGTLRYEPQSNHSYLQSGGYTSLHSACDTCRARKLKCGGQKKTCDRCKSTSTKCTYSEVGSSNRRRRKHIVAAEQKKTSISSNSPTPSPSKPTQATQFSQSVVALDSPIEAVPGSGNGDEGQESTLFPEENSLFDTFASPPQHSEEDCIISDHILDDLMSDLGTPNLEGYPNQPKSPAQMSLNEYNNHAFDLVRIPEHDNLILDENRTFSAHGNSPFTSPDIGAPAHAVNCFTRSMQSEPTGPTQHFSTATSHLQVDRLPFQQQLKEEEQARRERASALPATSPPFNTRQPGFKAPSKDWSFLPKDRSDQGACQCLQSILGLLEELENRASTTYAYTMDSVLAYHKEALNHCIHMVRCSACTARSDYMMLLGVVSDKLITSYEQIINKNTENARKGVENSERRSGTSSSSSSSSGVGGGGGEAREGLARVVSLGYYKIDGPTEWEYVMRVLILLQVRQVFELLARMQHIALETSRAPQVSATRMREQRLKAITEKFKRFGQS